MRKGFDARKERALKTIQPNVETLEMMKRAGLNTEIFSGGGTGTYNIQHLTPGFTDVQVGSYIFMDMQYIGDREPDRCERLQRLRAVADRARDHSQRQVPGTADD